jgi:hypothetical protein
MECNSTYFKEVSMNNALAKHVYDTLQAFLINTCRKDPNSDHTQEIEAKFKEHFSHAVFLAFKTNPFRVYFLVNKKVFMITVQDKTYEYKRII